MQYGNNPIEIGRLQPMAYSLLLDRGYTSHEHLFEVGLIHMNGRLYDPLLRRFLNADEHIQDPYNTQNYNKYGYVYNNPLMYNEPSGELIPIVAAIAIGAAVGLASYTIALGVTGNIHNWNLFDAFKATFFGVIGGAVTFGVGEIFNVASQAGKLTQIGTLIQKSVGDFGLAIVQAGTHAVAQGVLSVFQGEGFRQAFWSGALGSLGASAFGALSGSIGAELSGGNFWEGAVIGGIVAGLNHVAHRQNPPPPEKSLLDTAGEWVTDYFDYNGDGQVAGWDYALGGVDVGIAIFDIVTVPSGEGVAAHIALKQSIKGGTKLWSSTKKLSSVKNAFGHWKKHRAEFPKILNAKEYVQSAKKFMHNSPKGTLIKTRYNGDILKYHPGTNTFGIMDAFGTPKTMFKPNDGIKYWKRQ